ncbi:hypothetical protein XNW1_1470016 [Xenorhabdus nematophila str. Websteri]|nr:hypothetical protein XNA1_1720016 [Xenorhabdus nematophila str. Anatoliense]CEE94955.1 hypothetical protein XNA1_4860017 [Xenorhabdus nematophila str. Anatoliense]CEF28980.1 hypothetical protein XNW1_1470016 [Xenorhabdus nematophila str. Websteri]
MSQYIAHQFKIRCEAGGQHGLSGEKETVSCGMFSQYHRKKPGITREYY